MNETELVGWVEGVTDESHWRVREIVEAAFGEMRRALKNGESLEIVGLSITESTVDGPSASHPNPNLFGRAPQPVVPAYRGGTAC